LVNYTPLSGKQQQQQQQQQKHANYDTDYTVAHIIGNLLVCQNLPS